MRIKRTLTCGYTYTTGACAAAAARGAMLILSGKRANRIVITLPCGESASFIPRNVGKTRDGSFCEIEKDAGDDPDVTNGAVIRADIHRMAEASIVIRGGTGVGTVTRPGLPVAVGEPAINPVPRRMIRESVIGLIPRRSGIEIVISVANGERLAKKTLNPRLGIVGGISILGTTGIVVPYSHEAFQDAIRCSLDVAQAMQLGMIVLSTGRSSERAARHFYKDLPEASFVIMGDYVGFAVREALRRTIQKIIIACYPAKLLKIAAGALCTHVRSSAIDLELLADIAVETALTASVVGKIRAANTVRHAFTTLSKKEALGICRGLADTALRNIESIAQEILSSGATTAFQTEVLVVGYDDEVLLSVCGQR